MESPNTNNSQILNPTDQKPNKSLKRFLLLLNCALLALGGSGGPLVMRLYFLKGGKGVWISSALETAGWPLILLPLSISYLRRRKTHRPAGKPTKLLLITLPIFFASAAIGLLTGLDDFLYAYGVARLPISTSALIIASQLGFTAGFAFLLVRQKFTSFSVNAVFLLSVGAVVLAFHSGSDRPENETDREYWMGFFMTLCAAALYGFVLPLIELVYKRSKVEITYTLVMEMQLVMSFFATVFCGVGMVAHNDFKGMAREANEYELGKSMYAVVVFFSAVLWQCFFMGATGVIFYGSSLLSGIIITAMLPVVEVLAVVFYAEKFRVEKALSLVLSIWGFISYFYGEFKQSNKNNRNSELEMP